MRSASKDTCCSRTLGENETPVAAYGYSDLELVILAVARFYWQAFAVPESQSWLLASDTCRRTFPEDVACRIATAVLDSVLAMRRSRSSCFHFNNPNCPGCAEILSEHERQFMNVFSAVHAHRKGPARTHAMILCEGACSDDFLASLAELSSMLPASQHRQRRSARAARLI